MNAWKLRVKGPAGTIEAVVEHPAGEPRGLALIAHPHPLHGGSLDNKVVSTLARAARRSGRIAVRPNFRGVGATEGEYDHGVGETEDMLAVADAVGAGFPGLAWSLFGFSFGAYVQHRVAAHLSAERLVMVGPAVGMYEFSPPSVRTEIVHGEVDELIPLGVVADHARLHSIPLHVVPGAGHFFHGRLLDLRARIAALLEAG